MSEVMKWARLSEDRRYRYELARHWDRDKPPALFIGLNPSTADENEDDPTIRRCIRFARDWGYGGMLMGNLFAYRATDPSELLELVKPPKFTSPVAEPAQPRWHYDYVNANDRHLRAMAERAGMVVACWGASKMPSMFDDRPARVIDILGAGRVHCLGTTKYGYPKHPLYLKADTRPIPMMQP